MDNKILDFYKQTSLYTDLGLYKDFMSNLTDNINELCVLQRKQIIHPVALIIQISENKKNVFGEI
mgnify:CR=1 FL=1